jgi:uncharacterized protein YbjT (DUF2867 family)
MTILIVGATGTLGRQIVSQAVELGYPVRCLVRNVKKASFLSNLGAELVYGDLTLPETLPFALRGITVVIDAATFRATEEVASLREVDLIGKVALIKAAKCANVKRFIFFSIANNREFTQIPLMRLKSSIESTLHNSGIPYTIFQISGFFQGIISQYAVPILDQQPILSTRDTSPISYINTQDISTFCLRSLLLDQTTNKTYVLGGQKSWLSGEIISLCEKLSGQTATVRFFPLFILRFLINFTSFFKWGWDITDRLEFIDVLGKSQNQNSPVSETFEIFNFYDLLPLETYLQEYFSTILKKLRTLNYDQDDFINRKDLQF